MYYDYMVNMDVVIETAYFNPIDVSFLLCIISAKSQLANHKQFAYTLTVEIAL